MGLGNSGFTETNYTQLTELYRKYKDQGILMILPGFFITMKMLINCFYFLLMNGLWFVCSGLVILAFPCNQFLNQEPGTSQDAHEFACTRFKAEYPVFQKVPYLSTYHLFLETKQKNQLWKCC